MRSGSNRLVVGRGVVLALALVACGPENVIGPANQLQVTNAADNFQFQVSNLRNVTQTLSYGWTNTGDSANVNQASSVTGGSATLIIGDLNGVVVYQSGLQYNGTFHTQKSATGMWQIHVALTNFDGTLNFRVQKAP
jgi:hypothetical protein